jgi:hypothetical protein
VLLHDNAHTAETLWKLKFNVMAHPPYSPDQASSDYHLFGPLIESLRDCRFTSDQEVKDAAHAWLTAQLKTLFSEGIRKLVQQQTKCIEKPGDYNENDHSYLCSQLIVSLLYIDHTTCFGYSVVYI